jgi:hypothetical protein
MSLLTDKINSYTLERNIPLDGAYQLPPAMSGTLAASTAWTLVGTAPTQVAGPMAGQSAQRFNVTSTGSRLRSTGNEISLANDQNYSFGAFLKWTQWPTINSVAAMISSRPFGTGGFLAGAFIETDSLSPNFGKKGIRLNPGGSGYDTYDDQIAGIAENKWIYVAIRRNGSEAYLYINGQQVAYLTGIPTDTTTGTFFDLGTGSATFPQIVDIANVYMTSYSAIDATAIAEIYDTSKLNLADPIAVTATMVDPVVSTQSTVVLSSKILSYSPELYWQFNETVNYSPFNKPTNLGSYNYSASPNWSTRNVDNITPYLNAGGGVRGTGSWVFSLGGGTDSTPPDLRLNTNTVFTIKRW